jgi:YHS domain-containing protein
MKKNIVLVLFLGLLAAGCGKQPAPQTSEQTNQAATTPAETAIAEVVIRQAKPEEIGKTVTCPVMGSVFKVAGYTQVADYKGKSYYFCCAGCPGEFKENPEKYAHD